jgi:class 3 adenylate cyclase
VTVLFCDLAGFTARSDRADPEDVKATLRPFHSRIAREIEGHGGTLDKFIGDAVVGVFGAPASHEDDPERAVRAAIRIHEAIDELNAERPGLELAARIGVDTGEAVVVVGPGPQVDERVTGEVLASAAILQTVASVGEIAVGETTHRAIRDLFVFEELEAVTPKSGGPAVRAWRLSHLATRARAPDSRSSAQRVRALRAAYRGGGRTRCSS